MIIILLNYILVVICTLLVIIPTWKLIKAVIKRKKDGSEPESGLLTAAMISNTLAVAIMVDSAIVNFYDEANSLNRLLADVRMVLLVLAIAGFCYSAYQTFQYLQRAKKDSWTANTDEKFQITYSTFQAIVETVKVDRLFVRDVFVKVEDVWFPYSYPTAQRNEFLTLYLRSYSEKRKIRKGDAISFEAAGDITVERTGNNTKVWVGGLLDGHDLKHLEKLETSDIPKEKRLEVWYKAERTYCDYCIYSIICKERSLPCIIMSDTNGGWAREEIKKCYPKLIDEVTEKLRDQISFSGCFGGIIKWYEDEAAKAVGFEKACAIIFCTPDEPLQAGSRICAIGGDPIDSEEALNKVLELEKNRTLGRMVTVETQAPNQKPITKLITLEDPRKVAEYLITQMPYAGEKEKDGWIYN